MGASDQKYSARNLSDGHVFIAHDAKPTRP